MPATAAWLASAEALLNRSMAGSSRGAALAQRLQGTALQIDIEGLTRIRATVSDRRLALLGGDDSPADAHISGSPIALLQLFRGGAIGGASRPPSARASVAGATPSSVEARASVQIRGDAEIANLYRELFILAKPDPEEELSRWLGDMPARGIVQFAKRGLSWARRAGRTGGENIAEYLQEESRDLVNGTELEEFLHGVDGLRETTDRVEARLAKLEQRLAQARGRDGPSKDRA